LARNGREAWADPLQIQLDATKSLLREKLKRVLSDSELKTDSRRRSNLYEEESHDVNHLFDSLAKKERI
jgi:hypothetical protein